MPIVLKLLAIPVTAAVVLIGLWVTGALITNDFGVAMWLTIAWMTLTGCAALAVAVRSRPLRWPVLGAYALIAALAGAYLRHPAAGVATAIRLARGGRVLTLTGFEVDNGPDLRLHLVAGAARAEDEVRDFVDLGRHATVVVWCRAFSVLFARAPLR